MLGCLSVCLCSQRRRLTAARANGITERIYASLYLDNVTFPFLLAVDPSPPPKPRTVVRRSNDNWSMMLM
jgi:hypothetical protein